MDYDKLLDEMYYEEEDILKDIPKEMEYQRAKIDPEAYSIENLLNVIDTLEDKLEALTDKYNDIVDDYESVMNAMIDVVGYHAERHDLGLE